MAGAFQPQVVTFPVFGAKEFCVHIMPFVRFADRRRHRPVALASYMKGVINLRWAVLPLIGLGSQQLDMEPCMVKSAQRIV